MLSVNSERNGERNGGIYMNYSGGMGKPTIRATTIQQRQDKAESVYNGIKMVKKDGGLLIAKYYAKLKGKK
jgi:hypothetical protein